ncbi:sodium:proton antiporter [Sphingomonas koreensis]|nr:sodium:proton antiporter [Sphingomonas koreensis]
MPQQPSYLFAALVVAIAATAWINARTARAPLTVVLTAVGLIAALLIDTLDRSGTTGEVRRGIRSGLARVDLPQFLFDFLLAFLLFAAGISVNVHALRKVGLTVFRLAIYGTIISTVLVGAGFLGAARLLAIPMTLGWAFAFAALISPTDPVSVSAAAGGGDDEAETTILRGESLFNDGVAIVLFGWAIRFAGGEHVDLLSVGGEILMESAIGLAVGVTTGYVARKAVATIEDYSAEVLLTLALAIGSYTLANALGGSGPIAGGTAGLMMAGSLMRGGINEGSREYVLKLWTLIDDILSAVLFLFLGLEVFMISSHVDFTILSFVAILLTLVARVLTVGVVTGWERIAPWPGATRFEWPAASILIWGGGRGAISVALALALPPSPFRDTILTSAFCVAIFSILIQAPTLGWLTRRVSGGPVTDEAAALEGDAAPASPGEGAATAERPAISARR